MTRGHDKPRPARREAEPVQVYLALADQQRLDRLTAQLGATKSDVLRRGLEALEHQVVDPAGHPALRIIGIAGTASAPATHDVAREHDRFLADTEIASWARPRRSGRGR
ncbi:MAG: hypothetical protein ACREL5_13165 [Gemmatimonadales bacterium]